MAMADLEAPDAPLLRRRATSLLVPLCSLGLCGMLAMAFLLRSTSPVALWTAARPATPVMSRGVAWAAPQQQHPPLAAAKDPSASSPSNFASHHLLPAAAPMFTTAHPMATPLLITGACGAFFASLLGVALMRFRAFLRNDALEMAMASTSGETDEIKVPEGFTPPTPRKFTVPEGETGRVIGAAIPSLIRLFNGLLIEGWKPSIAGDDDGSTYSFLRLFGFRLVEASAELPSTRPEKPIQLWEYQGSPYCRKVREACCVLDLDVEIFPCPQQGPTYRPEAKARGWPTFPHMIDPNTGTDLGESDDIVGYLFQTYGAGRPVPFLLSSNPLNTASLYMAALARYQPGSIYVPAKKPSQPLEIWSYEPSPFSIIAREALSELELPHIVHYCPRGSVHRDDIIAKAGLCQLPYLEDPNTGVKMFESTAIAQYLYDVYAKKE